MLLKGNPEEKRDKANYCPDYYGTRKTTNVISHLKIQNPTGIQGLFWAVAPSFAWESPV